MAPKLRKLNIEVTTRCNLNCEMCLRTVLHEDRGDMNLPTYMMLVPIFPEIEAVNFLGVGEPLLNEHLLEMIRLARSHLPAKGTLSFTTNGTLIDKGLARHLVSSGVDNIVISIDSATADVYNQIRQGADLDAVLRNVRLLVQAKKQLGSRTPWIGFESVAMKKNVGGLPAVVELAAEYEASFVIVSHLLPHTEEMNKQIIYEFNSDEALDIYDEAAAKARSRSLELALHPDFIPDIQLLFGMPPLRGSFSPAISVRAGEHGIEKEQILRILEEARDKAVAHKVVLNFVKLLQGNSLDLDYYAQIFDQAKAKAKQYGIALELPPLRPRAQRECGFIRDGVSFVGWDGDVRPCNNLYHSYSCFINDRAKSIHSVSFGNVWPRISDRYGTPRTMSTSERRWIDSIFRPAVTAALPTAAMC